MLDSFGLYPGRILARKYEVLSLLGAGWEGEVYKIREIATEIERAAKFFFPLRNPRDRAINFYAKKLHKLRHCPILIQYHTQEKIIFGRKPLTFLVSDYVEGELLSGFLLRQPGKRLNTFQALHLLHALASGIAIIHDLREYHGDLHTDNIIIQRYGLGFDIKLIDMIHWGTPRPENIHDMLWSQAVPDSQEISYRPPASRLPRDDAVAIASTRISLPPPMWRSHSSMLCSN
jgi:serine/threonine protein kinase